MKGVMDSESNGIYYSVLPSMDSHLRPYCKISENKDRKSYFTQTVFPSSTSEILPPT